MIKMESKNTAENSYRKASTAITAAKAGAAALGVVLMVGAAVAKRLPKKPR